LERGTTSTVSPFGDAMETPSHLLEVGDHVVEGGGEVPDFVVAVNVNVLIKIAGVADFRATVMRCVNGSVIDLAVRKAISTAEAQRECAGCIQMLNRSCGRGFCCIVPELLDFRISLVKNTDDLVSQEEGSFCR